MFDKMKDPMKQMAVLQQLMKDESFKALMSHPKVQELFRDPEFVQLMQAQDVGKLLTHPKLAALLRDPDVAALMAKLPRPQA